MQRLLICFLAAVSLAAATSVAIALTSTLTKTNVEASPEALFALIEDFQKWGKWSPHEKADSKARRIYSDPPRGKGAIYEWDGDAKIGAGHAQIVEVHAPTKIIIDLELTRPVTGRLALNFTIERIGADTKIEVATNGQDELVKYVMSSMFNGSLFGISCAAGGSPKGLCNVMMKDLIDQP